MYYPWCSSYRLQSHIFVENRDFSLSHLHSTPPLGGFRLEYYHKVWCAEKLEWRGYPMVKKSEDTITRFDRIHERDGRTDRRTYRRTPHDGIGPTLMHSIARQKKINKLTSGQSNLTKSASRGANSPVRGHPRGSKFVPLNS